jgi:hypothetical protein
MPSDGAQVGLHRFRLYGCVGEHGAHEGFGHQVVGQVGIAAQAQRKAVNGAFMLLVDGLDGGHAFFFCRWSCCEYPPGADKLQPASKKNGHRVRWPWTWLPGRG